MRPERILLEEMGWTPEVTEDLRARYQAKACVLEAGASSCMFCKPTDEQLEKLRRLEVEPGADYFGGRNVYIFGWWGNGIKDHLRLIRILVRHAGPGGRVAWHTSGIYREAWVDDHPWRSEWAQPQQFQ